MREAAFASVKILLLQKYLNAQQIEDYVCPASVELLKLGGLPEDVVKERHPDAFVVRANFILHLYVTSTYIIYAIYFSVHRHISCSSPFSSSFASILLCFIVNVHYHSHITRNTQNYTPILSRTNRISSHFENKSLILIPGAMINQ